MKKGFTLMEILVAIAILAITGTIILNVFSRSLRGGNKAQILLAIKQNGQTVLDQMDKTIRSADEVVCIASQPLSCSQNTSGETTGHTVVIVRDGIYTRYRFIEGTVTQNGKIIQDNPARATDGFEDDICLFITRVCNPEGLMPETVVLTDTNSTSGISIIKAKDSSGNDLPFITRDKLSGYRDSITLQFGLKQGTGVASGTTTDIDPVNFKTTIQLR